MEEGGLTPSYNLVKDVSEIATIPLRVMIRDTSKSFIYDKEIMDSHIKFIESIKDLNIEGIIFGSLTNEGKINFDDLEKVIKAKGHLKLTFHRAFDELAEKDAIDQFKKLSKYDVDYLLTSGTKQSAEEGISIIKKLVETNTINVLAGKSINVNNAKKIIEETGVDFIHVGLSIREDNTMNTKIDVDKLKKIIKEINNG